MARKIPISDLRSRTLINDRNAIQIPPATTEAEMTLDARVRPLVFPDVACVSFLVLGFF